MTIHSLFLPAALSILVSAARAEWQSSLSDDVTLGKDRYTANTVDLSVAPSRSFGGDLSIGVNKTASPVKDSTNSGGVGLWFNPGPNSSVSFNGSRYQGVHGAVYDLDGGYLGDAPDRQVSSSLGGTFTYKFLRPENPDEEGGVTFSGSAGLFFGGHTIPVWTQTPGGIPKHPGNYRIGDRGLTLGLVLGAGNTSAGLSGRFHKYSFPTLATLPPKVFLYLLNTSVNSAIYGLPMSETTVYLAQRFLGSLTADAAVTFEKLSTDLDVQTGMGKMGRMTITGVTPVTDSNARTVSLTLSWDAASWLSLRAGGFSTKQDTSTSNYGTAGVSVYF